MGGLEMHGQAVRLHHVVQVVRDLLPEPFLNREPPRVDANQPRELRDADDLLVRDVRHVSDAVERERVMLAEREERDRTLDDLADRTVGTAVALGREGRQQLGITLVSGSGLEQGTDETPRGGAGPGRVQIHPERLEHLCDGTLETAPLVVGDGPRPNVFPRRRLLRIGGFDVCIAGRRHLADQIFGVVFLFGTHADHRTVISGFGRYPDRRLGRCSLRLRYRVASKRITGESITSLIDSIPGAVLLLACRASSRASAKPSRASSATITTTATTIRQVELRHPGIGVGSAAFFGHAPGAVWNPSR